MGILTNAISAGNVAYSSADTEIKTTYDLGDGNHYVKVRGSGVTINTCEGNSTINVNGNNTTISTGNGNQNVTVIGNGLNLTTKDGNDDVVLIGDNATLDLGDGDNSLLYWGNNVKATMGAGNDKVETFDQAYKRGDYTSLNQAFIDSLPTAVAEKITLLSKEAVNKDQSKEFFYSKYYTYYNCTYEVEKTLTRYINGCIGSNIDMGEGTNTANVTLAAGSTITGTGGTNKITYNQPWQITESLGSETKEGVAIDTNKDYRWGNIALTAVGGLALGAGLYLVGDAYVW